jgi:hypothetical protein
MGNARVGAALTNIANATTTRALKNCIVVTVDGVRSIRELSWENGAEVSEVRLMRQCGMPALPFIPEAQA